MNANKIGWKVGTCLIFMLSGIAITVTNYNSVWYIGLLIAIILNFIGFTIMDNYSKT